MQIAGQTDQDDPKETVLEQHRASNDHADEHAGGSGQTESENGHSRTQRNSRTAATAIANTLATVASSVMRGRGQIDIAALHRGARGGRRPQYGINWKGHGAPVRTVRCGSPGGRFAPSVGALGGGRVPATIAEKKPSRHTR